MCQSSVYCEPQIFSFNFYRQLLVSPSPTDSALAPLHFPDQNKVPVSAVDLLIDDNPKKKNQRNVKLCCQIFWLGSSSDKRQSEDFFLNIKSCPWAAHISSAEPRASVGRYKDLSYHRLQHHCTALHWLSIVTRVPQFWHRYCDAQYSEAAEIISQTLVRSSTGDCGGRGLKVAVNKHQRESSSKAAAAKSGCSIQKHMSTNKYYLWYWNQPSVKVLQEKHGDNLRNSRF